VVDASGPRRADETHVNGWHGPLDRWKGQTRLAGAWPVGSMERSKPSWRTAWYVGPMEGSNEVGAGHDPLDRREGQTKLADGMVCRIEGGVKTKLAHGMIHWIDGGVRRAASLALAGGRAL
jgi:hypothetical protein